MSENSIVYQNKDVISKVLAGILVFTDKVIDEEVCPIGRPQPPHRRQHQQQRAEDAQEIGDPQPHERVPLGPDRVAHLIGGCVEKQPQLLEPVRALIIEKAERISRDEIIDQTVI